MTGAISLPIAPLWPRPAGALPAGDPPVEGLSFADLLAFRRGLPAQAAAASLHESLAAIFNELGFFADEAMADGPKQAGVPLAEAGPDRAPASLSNSLLSVTPHPTSVANPGALGDPAIPALPCEGPEFAAASGDAPAMFAEPGANRIPVRATGAPAITPAIVLGPKSQLTAERPLPSIGRARPALLPQPRTAISAAFRLRMDGDVLALQAPQLALAPEEMAAVTAAVRRVLASHGIRLGGIKLNGRLIGHDGEEIETCR